MARGRESRQWTPVDDAGNVAVDLPCANCGYNLRTQPVDDVCPECGHAVEPSTRSFLLRDASHEWVSNLAAGAGLLALLLIPTDMYFLARTLSLAKFAVPGDGAVWWIWCCGPVFIGGVVIALALLAARDPLVRLRKTSEGVSARRVIVYSLWAPPVGWLCAEAFRHVSPDAAAYVLLALIFGTAQTFCWVVLPFAVMRRLSNLLRRAPAPFLAGAAKVMAYLLAIDGLATAGALALWRFPVRAPAQLIPTSAPASYTPDLGELTALVEQMLVGGPAFGAILGAFALGVLVLARVCFRDAIGQSKRSAGGE